MTARRSRPSRPTPHCRALMTRVSQYVDGELSAPERRAVERHLGACRDCAGCVSTLRRMIATCRRMKPLALPPAVRRRARARIRALLSRG